MSKGEIKRMWWGGPLRKWSPERISAGWTQYDKGGYAGPYVCDCCGDDVGGVYRVNGQWICGGCKSLDNPGRPSATRVLAVDRSDMTVSTPALAYEGDSRAER